jgi:hypothetical protein
MELWKRIAQDYLIAAANAEVGKAIARIVQEQLRKFEGELDLNFSYDAKAGGLLKGSDTGFSFPARPHSFDEEGGLNGTFLVTMHLNPPVSGAGPEIAGTATTVSMEVEFFFKTPTEPGGGKRMWKTPAGQLEVTFGPDGQPDIADTGDVALLVEVITELEERAFTETPKGAKSLTRDPQHRKEQRELNEIGRKNREEQERERAQELQRKVQKEADKAQYGSVETFVDYIMQQGLEEFSLADLQKVLQTMFPDNASRAIAQAEIKKQIEGYGLRFNPGLKKLSSRLNLLRIAARVAS